RTIEIGPGRFHARLSRDRGPGPGKKKTPRGRGVRCRSRRRGRMLEDFAHAVDSGRSEKSTAGSLAMNKPPGETRASDSAPDGNAVAAFRCCPAPKLLSGGSIPASTLPRTGHAHDALHVVARTP